MDERHPSKPLNTPSDALDLIIRGGTVIDGTHAPRFDADVGIAAGRIVALGDLSLRRAAQEIDARGRIVAPGFIDSHTHDDQALLAQPDMSFKVSQGVTTVIAGNCGISIAPLHEGSPLPPPLNLLDIGERPRFGSFAAYFDALQACAGGGERGGAGRPHEPARQRDERPRPPRQRRRDRCDARAARRGAGRRRDRPFHRHLLRAGRAGADRGDHRASAAHSAAVAASTRRTCATRATA